jgi:hypothetical protein
VPVKLTLEEVTSDHYDFVQLFVLGNAILLAVDGDFILVR